MQNESENSKERIQRSYLTIRIAEKQLLNLKKEHCKAYSGRTEVRKLYENEYFIDKDLKMSGCIPAETREYNIQYFYDRTGDLAPSRLFEFM